MLNPSNSGGPFELGAQGNFVPLPPLSAALTTVPTFRFALTQRLLGLKPTGEFAFPIVLLFSFTEVSSLMVTLVILTLTDSFVQRISILNHFNQQGLFLALFHIAHMRISQHQHGYFWPYKSNSVCSADASPTGLPNIFAF